MLEYTNKAQSEDFFNSPDMKNDLKSDNQYNNRR